MDTEAMRNADAVVCICEEMKKAIVGRGVSSARLFVVPNAVDDAVFRPTDGPAGRDQAELPWEVQEVRALLRNGTVGYVGSLRKLEGVAELVRAAGEMAARGHDVSLLIVGDGPDLDELKELARTEGIAERAVFTGRVPHDLVALYYDLIDVFVISRPPSRVARLVTPLKPLEAMAMGKAVVVSDLPALREIVQDGETGLVYHPGQVGDLADKCLRLLQDRMLRRRLTTMGSLWARRERTWARVLEGLAPAYRVAAERAEARGAEPVQRLRQAEVAVP
jgi:glycosyltransferase involved in cell wall biosynthesis